ncbi:NADH-quinone oxidoreductase subunit M [Mycobacterium intermedium]|uniref:NADH-quinone oxidoreductase subunit M n=1 Tax=Mycobacterium intermedium TaxID=28445 RepID=A0A1E3SE72_MYCIE|nr:NADH-quinone oxidoreductase subunit M [Mycobacterium intermedium]MCV6967604.1 NADH-quinone oxidoreductase subunit M [Mycobacterium intermedium]ODR00476.1 NADH-quinone oxidoreductase subunit M [Mycobacterium intermedium]OPE50902.1 NADH-quinone oxidoreductase subunit M [Mycobacterium intermedium]ORB09351.1 NADH-quinone oxidoreductase subunit M [Mycobacterium intermedium]
MAPLLTALWVAPLAGSALVVAVPASRPLAAKYTALGVSTVVLAIVGVLLIRFDPSDPQYQFVEKHSWIRSFGASYLVGLDGVAMVLVVLTAVLMPLLLLAGWNDVQRPGESAVYLALMLVVESMMLIALVALDVLLFFAFFEAMLIPMYFLIGRYGGEGAPRAALKFLLYSLFGGLFMFVALIGLNLIAKTFDFRAITATVSAGQLTANPVVMHLLFVGFLLAFAVKAPLWPLHTWLPGLAAEATPATAVLMMAVVDKIGTFGMLRYCLQLFPGSATLFRPFVIALAVIGIGYGALVAIGQSDVIRVIAYTSISHFGFIVLGIFAMTSQGQSGAALYMVNHGLSTAALFLIAGFLVSRRGTRLIADYGGVQQVAPVLAGTFLVAGMASLALPGLAPFVSEFLVLIGTFTRYPMVAVCAATALVLSAIYILWLYQRMMTGPVADGNHRVCDLLPRELAVVVPLLAMLIALGVYPKPALDVINPSIEHLAEHHVTNAG